MGFALFLLTNQNNLKVRRGRAEGSRLLKLSSFGNGFEKFNERFFDEKEECGLQEYSVLKQGYSLW